MQIYTFFLIIEVYALVFLTKRNKKRSFHLCGMLFYSDKMVKTFLGGAYKRCCSVKTLDFSFFFGKLSLTL